MKILVTGSSGLVGSRFLELSKFKDSFLTPSYPQFNLLSKPQVQDLIKKEKPDVVVHFAAYTDVGEAEKQRGDQNGSCWQLNVTAVENLLSSFSKPTHFIQISTDMVYSGSPDDPGPYDEIHEIEKDSQKVTWYGYTKGMGEQAVRKNLGENMTILRLIYPVRAKYDLKLDYLRKPLMLFDEGKLYPLFTDQQISISFIDEISQTLDTIITQKTYGTFHASSSNTGSPYEIISYLLKKVRGVENAVQPSSLKEFLKTVDTPVRYPEYGGLKVTRTEEKLAIKYSSWQEIINQLVEQGIET